MNAALHQGEKTIRLNGCHNRDALRKTVWVQDGYHLQPHPTNPNELIRLPRMKEIKDPMTKDCQHSKHYYDVGCSGCIHNTTQLKSS